MLAATLGIFETAIHDCSEVDWCALPDEFVIQMHWNRTPDILSFLARQRIQPIGIVRHPLDVLVSILHFCTYEPATARWLAGQGGSEASLIGSSPAHSSFLDYALSQRAEALLDVSAQWVAGGYAHMRYEDLVSSPVSTLQKFLHGQRISRPTQTVVRDHSLEALRQSNYNNHFWRGQPGIWRSLISESAAQQIYAHHKRRFDLLGYSIKGAARLSPQEVIENWWEINARRTHERTLAAEPIWNPSPSGNLAF